MAKDVKLIIKGDTRDAEAALRDLERTGGGVASRLERDFDQLGTKSSLVFDDQRQAAQRAFDRIKNSGIATNDELKRAQRSLSDELTRIDTEQYGKRTTLAQQFKDNWLTVTAGLSAAYMVKNFAESALTEFKTFESALTDMAKVTAQPLGEIKQQIMALPPELGSATEMIQGYYNVMSAGVTDPKKAMELLVTASKAAKAAHIDQGTAVEALTKLMAGFGDSIKSAEAASDLLFGIENIGQTTYAELAPVIGGLASLSAQVKVLPNEMGGVLAVLTQTAGSTSQAATQYEAIMAGFIKPTKTMLETIKGLGYESAQELIGERGLTGALMAVKSEAEKSLGPQGLGKLFESKEAIAGLGPMFADSMGKANAAIKGVGDQAGSTSEAFERWKGTFEGIETTFRNTVGKIMVEIGEQLAPMVKAQLTGLATWMGENKQGIVDFFTGIITVVKGVVAVIGTLVSAWKAVVDEFARLYTAWENGIGSGLWETMKSAAGGGFIGAGIRGAIGGGGNADPTAPFGTYTPGGNGGGDHTPGDGVGPMPQSVVAGLPSWMQGVAISSVGKQSSSSAAQSSASGPVTISPVFNLSVPAGTDAKSAKVVAREFARLVTPEIHKLNPRFA